MAKERLGEMLVRLYGEADARRRASPTVGGRVKESLVQTSIAAAAISLLPLAVIIYPVDKWAERINEARERG